MSTIIALPIDLIESNPNLRGGWPLIVGTGVTVHDVAAQHTFHAQSVDDIALNFGLSLAQVHAALAYYYSHKSEIDAQILETDAQIQAAKERRIGQRHQALL